MARAASKSSKKWFVPKKSWLRKSKRANIVTLAIVVLVFGGVGTYLVKKSHAINFNAYCPSSSTEGWGYNTSGYCVQQIKADFNALGNPVNSNWRFPYSLDASDSNWSSYAAADTRWFQSNWHIRVDGIFGRNTWFYMCVSLNNHHLGDRFDDSGCNNGY